MFFNTIVDKYRNSSIQVKASFWFLICTIIQRSISIITTPIFTRLLSTNEYGKYSVFISWMGILTCFVTMYIYSGVYPQAIVKFDHSRAKYSSAMQGLTFTLTLFWLLIYGLFFQFWNKLFELNTAQMLAMFIVMWAHAVFGFWSAEQRVDYKYKLLVIVTLVEAILQPCLCILLIYLSEDKVTGLVLGMAIATFFCYTALFVNQMVRGKVYFSKEIWSYTLRLAIPLIPHYISTVLLNSSDRIMIQKFVGVGEAGIYNLAYTISICGVLINQALLQTLQPWIYQKIKAEQFQEIKKVAYPALCGVALVNLCMILFAPELIKIFAPASYSAAKWVMAPIAMSVYFMFMYNLFSCFEFYYEKTSYVSIATVSGALLNLLLNFILLPRFGYYAAGYTTLFCYFVFAVAHYGFMRKICKFYLPNIKVYDINVISLISVIFVALAFSIMLLYSFTLLRYIVFLILIVFILIYRDRIKNIYYSFKNNNLLTDDGSVR